MSSTLVGMFDNETAAEQARNQLIAAGFASSAISMTGGTASSSTAESYSSGTGSGEPHQEGAIARFFDHLFGGSDNDDAQNGGAGATYKEAFRRGSYGITVITADDEETDRAESVLNRAGAVDIDEKAQSWRTEGWTGGTTAAPMASQGSTLGAGATQKLQEVEEELKVGKRSVIRGGVRIFSRLTEVPVEESVRLREEHAQVQRHAVDRPATEADFATFKEGSVEVREMGEEVVVSKTARVVGEVEIGKTATEHDETVRDTVRKTQVDVEQIDPSLSKAASSRATAAVDTGTPMTESPIRVASSGAVGGRPIGPGTGSVAGSLSGQEISESDEPTNDTNTKI